MAETTRRQFIGRTGSLLLASSLTGCGIEGTLQRAEREATPIPQITHPKVPIVGCQVGGSVVPLIVSAPAMGRVNCPRIPMAAQARQVAAKVTG